MKRVKVNTQKWFDGEVLENINTRYKLFKRLKKSRLHIDKELYKKAKYNNYSKLQQIYWKTKRAMGNLKIARHAKE